MQKLRTGAAYHGCRMLNHVADDMRDMADNHMNLVVHMLSHTDWDRHCRVMKEIVEISEEAGLEVWLDNWGLGGPPGDKSHFLAYHPEAHQIYSDGTPDPVRACLRQPSFRQFVHEWIDTVAWTGAKTIFWDEPHLPTKDGRFSCACPLCRKAFEEKYGHPMPETMTEEAAEFRLDTIADYFRDICDYAASKELNNAVCVMLSEGIGINLSSLGRIGGIETEVPPVLGMDHPAAYRNKTSLPCAGGADQPVLGFYAPWSHTVIPVVSCPIRSYFSGIVSSR